jgi:hypothetical protein
MTSFGFAANGEVGEEQLARRMENERITKNEKEEETARPSPTASFEAYHAAPSPSFANLVARIPMVAASGERLPYIKSGKCECEFV